MHELKPRIAVLTFLIGTSPAMCGFALHPNFLQGPLRAHSTVAPKVVRSTEGEWRKITRSKFTFNLPADMKQVEAHCRYTECQKFSNGRLEIEVSYGTAYELSPNVGYLARDQPEYLELEMEIGGMKADVSTHYDDAYTFKHVAWLDFPILSDGKAHFSMKAFCTARRELEMALQVFRTVEFLK
jgi:hypothetical protein